MLPTYAPLSVSLPSTTARLLPRTRRLTAVCCSLPLSLAVRRRQRVDGVGGGAPQAEGLIFSRACGGPFFARLRRAPVAS